MSTETKAPTLTFEGKEYLVSDLSQEAIAHVSHLQVAEAEIVRQQQLIRVLETGRYGVIENLRKALAENSEDSSEGS